MRRVHGALLLALASAGCTAGSGTTDSDRRENLVITDPRIDAWMARAFDSSLAPGMAVAVVQGDSILYLNGFGYADREANREVTPESQFYIASSTKSFTGMAAAILRSRGTIDLDSSLAHYLPDLRMEPPLSAAEVTLRDLLTHTHGISSDPIVFRLAFTGQHDPELLESLLARAEPSEDGRVFDYGNIGYNIATIALDHFLEKSWKEVLQDELFDPLGMASTTAYISRTDPSRLVMPYSTEPGGQERIAFGKDDANMQSAGGLVTTAADLAPWLIANLNSGRVNGRQVIPAGAVAIAHRPTAEEDDSYQGFTRTGYSLGWHHGMYRGERFVHHFGGFSGFHAHISFMPERDIGVAVLVNNDGLGSFLATTTAKGIYDVLVDGPGVEAHLDSLLTDRAGEAAELREGVAEDRARRAARPQELPHPLEAYTGTYRNEDFGTMVWTVKNGALRVDMGVAGSDVEVYNGEKNQLRVELTGGGMVVGFMFEGGRAERLAMRGGEIVFERVE